MYTDALLLNVVVAEGKGERATGEQHSLSLPLFSPPPAPHPSPLPLSPPWELFFLCEKGTHTHPHRSQRPWIAPQPRAELRRPKETARATSLEEPSRLRALPADPAPFSAARAPDGPAYLLPRRPSWSAWALGRLGRREREGLAWRESRRGEQWQQQQQPRFCPALLRLSPSLSPLADQAAMIDACDHGRRVLLPTGLGSWAARRPSLAHLIKKRGERELAAAAAPPPSPPRGASPPLSPVLRQRRTSRRCTMRAPIQGAAGRGGGAEDCFFAAATAPERRPSAVADEGGKNTAAVFRP